MGSWRYTDIVGTGVTADPPSRTKSAGGYGLPSRILPHYFRVTVRVKLKIRVRLKVIAFAPSIIEEHLFPVL